MDNTGRFDGRAGDYTAGRPGYAAALIDCMYGEYGVSASSVIADIGSGTGKFARHLLERGSEVYGVEPNDDMRHAAEKELCGYPRFHSVKGGAEDTTLAACTIDHITVAQAFHWFDPGRFRRECARMIRDGGRVFLIWNVRDVSDPVNRELSELFKRYCPEFRGFGGGIERDDPRIKEFFDGRYERVSFSSPLVFDKERFKARCLSGSYSLKDGDKGYEEYLSALTDLFDRYSVNGIVTTANDSVAYIGSVK